MNASISGRGKCNPRKITRYYYNDTDQHLVGGKFNPGLDTQRKINANTKKLMDQVFEGAKIDKTGLSGEIDEDAFIRNATYSGIGKKYNSSVDVEISKYAKIQMDKYLIFLDNWNKTLDYRFLQELKVALMLFHKKYNFQRNGVFFKCNDHLSLIEEASFDSEILISKINLATTVMYSVKYDGHNLIQYIEMLNKKRDELGNNIKEQLKAGVIVVKDETRHPCQSNPEFDENIENSDDDALNVEGVTYSCEESELCPIDGDEIVSEDKIESFEKTVRDLKKTFLMKMTRRHFEVLDEIVIPRYNDLLKQTITALDEHLHHVKIFVRLKLVCLESSSKNYNLVRPMSTNPDFERYDDEELNVSGVVYNQN